MGRVLGIVYRCIATHLFEKVGFSRETARTGAVTLIQRFGSTLKIAPCDLVEPLDFIARLAALVPKPRVNLTRPRCVSTKQQVPRG
ncbi:MAG: hypothetical protein WBM97_00555 [Sedimenticolaceae bacterium]